MKKTSTMHKRRACLQALTFAALGACAASTWASAPLSVVTSFSILADVVKQVGGDRVAVTALVGPNSDAHAFAPAPKHAKMVAQAQLLVVNGWGFDAWMGKLVQQGRYQGQVVHLTEGLTPLMKPAKQAGHDHHDHGHAHAGKQDPHAWQDVRSVMHYVTRLVPALCQAAPADCKHFEQGAVRYQTELEALHQDVLRRWQAVPADKRQVFTSHAAYRYYGQAYGVTFAAAQGVSTESEPSAKAMGQLVRQIRASGARVVFLENISNPQLMKRLADETGARVGGQLYSDALTEAHGPAPTYVDLIKANTQTLIAALTS